MRTASNSIDEEKEARALTIDPSFATIAPTSCVLASSSYSGFGSSFYIEQTPS